MNEETIQMVLIIFSPKHTEFFPNRKVAAQSTGKLLMDKWEAQALQKWQDKQDIVFADVYLPGHTHSVSFRLYHT